MVGSGKLGEGVADELGLDAVLAVELLFEWEDHEHLVDVFLDELDAVLFPGPELRADEEDDRNAEAMELFGELEVDVGKVDEDGYIGAAVADGALQLTESAIDAGQVANHFGDAHDRHIFSTHDAFETSGGHARGRPCRRSGPCGRRAPGGSWSA